MKAMILIFGLLSSLSLLAADAFTVRPYLIVSEKNNVTLIFKTASDLRLQLSVNHSQVRSGLFSRDVLQKIDLGPLGCGKKLQYQLLNQDNQLLIERGAHFLPCEKSDPLYFGFLSDTQIKNQKGQKRADKLSALVAGLKNEFPFSVVINAGDIVQHGGREDEWLNFFQTADPYLKSSYLLSAIGNHEYFESHHRNVATPEFLAYMRDQHSSNLGNVSVDVGPVTILVLNSNFKFLSEKKIREQWTWLEEKLKENEAKKRPVFVSMHHSPYSSSAEYLRAIPRRLRKEFVPLIEKYSCVKMVLTGHLHMYERSLKKNIHYLVAGPSGGIMNIKSFLNPYKVLLRPFLTTFSLFELKGDQVTVKTFDTNKRVIDSFEVALR